MAEETLILLGLFTLLGWLFWLLSINRQRRQKQRVDFKAEVLARFDSPENLKAFLETEAGKALLGSDSSRMPLSRIMMASQLGLFLIVVGVGVVSIALLIAENTVLIPGVLLICGGGGFLLSALFSYWFSRKHGLLEPDQHRNNQKFEP